MANNFKKRRFIIPKRSSQLLKIFTHSLDKLAYVCEVLTGFALVTMTVIFSWLVYGRYVLNATPTWVEQASLLLIVFIGFLGAAVGIHKKTHLGVTFFRDKAPTPIKIILDMINHIIIMIFGFVMMIYSYELVLFKWGTKIPLIHLPEGLRAVPIMICGGLILLFSIGHILNYKDTMTNSKNS